jgi:hypothetical protein
MFPGVRGREIRISHADVRMTAKAQRVTVKVKVTA